MRVECTQAERKGFGQKSSKEITGKTDAPVSLGKQFSGNAEGSQFKINKLISLRLVAGTSLLPILDLISELLIYFSLTKFFSTQNHYNLLLFNI